jgi:hypothetical protein
MKQDSPSEDRKSHRRLEEAEDLIHDIYAETLERLPLIAGIRNLPAWINSLFSRRHERVRADSGEIDLAEECYAEIIAAIGLDPQDGFVGASLAEAVNDTLRKLSLALRHWIDE